MTPESGIQEELQQKRPFASRAEASVVALLRTADLVRQSVESVIAERGLSLVEYNVLRILRGAGVNGMTGAAIATRTLQRSEPVDEVLERLAARMLIESRGEGDGWQITIDGLELLTALDEPVRAVDAAALAGLSLRDMAALLDLLDRARRGLHEFLDG